MPERPTTAPPHRQAGYDAVYAMIQSSLKGGVTINALIWRAVEAYREASEAEHERQVRAKAAEEIEAAHGPDRRFPSGWASTEDRDHAARIARGDAR